MVYFKSQRIDAWVRTTKNNAIYENRKWKKVFFQVTFSQCVQPCGEYSWSLIPPSASSPPCGSQIASSSAFGAGFGNGAVFGIEAGIGSGIEAIASSGGAFPVYSAASTAPSGISVASENVYEGSLNVIGELPFLSAIGVEGVLPTAGAGAVHYGCGNGVTAITNEFSSAAGASGFGSSGIVSSATGYGFGLRGSSISGLNLGHVAGHHCDCGLY